MIDDKKREMLDQLAAHAMTGLLARVGTRIDNDRLAEKAYEVAAAMMEQRTRIHEEAKRMVAAAMIEQRTRIHEEAKRTVAAQQHNAAELAEFDARQRFEQYIIESKNRS